jgi:hypothetical protein
MQFWTNLWYKIWLDIPTSKKDDNISKNNISSSKSNVSKTIPTTPMMSYDIKWTILPWVSDEKAKQIVSHVDSVAKNSTEKQLMLSDLHEQAMKAEQKQAFQKDRNDMKNQLMKDSIVEKDPQKKWNYTLQLKLANFADMVREWAKNEWIDISDMWDQDIVTKYMDSRSDLMEDFQSYINWWISNLEMGKKIWLIQEETPVEDEEDIDIKNKLTNIWIWIWATAWWLWAMYWAWKWLESLWKAVYWLTLPPWVDEATAILKEKAWLWPEIRKTTDTAIEKWIVWTRTWIWVKSLKEANKIFTDTINPILEKATTKTNVQDLISKLEWEILTISKWDPDKLNEYKQAIEEMKKSFWDPKYNNLSQRELQDLKSWLQSRTPQKFFKWKEITNAYQELRAKLSSKLTNELHNNLTKEFWKDTAKIYKDWANLKWLSKIWVKSITQSWLKWWFGWFWSTIVEELGTPISTIWGKVAYESWKLLQTLPKTLLKLAKWSPAVIKTILKDSPAGLFAPDMKEVVDKWMKDARESILTQAKNKTWIFKDKTDEEINTILYGKSK